MTWRRLLIWPPNIAKLKAGEAGEEWVAYLYRLKGYKLLERNYEVWGRKKLGEIDIISKKRNLIVVVEVKTRRNERFMPVEETVHWRKQSYLRRMAKIYIQKHPQYENYNLQIDVVAVLLHPFDNFVESVKIIENAIEDV